MLKKLIPKCIKTELRRRLCYKYNKSVISTLKKSINQKRLILFLTPTHGNIGDHAIALCEQQFLNDYFKAYTIIEISDICWNYEKKTVLNYVRKEDCLLIHGGGFIGTLWKDNDQQFREVLQAFPNNKIVVFPQSVFFSNDAYGKEQLRLSRQIYTKHKQLYLCVREQNSYECVEKNALIPDMDNCLLIPDIVTYYKRDFSQDRRNNKVLLCFRNDKEKITDETVTDEIIHTLSKAGLEYSFTDTVLSYKIFGDRRDEEVFKKLQEFAQCRFVITDRLHGMLLAAVSATPCLFMDNCSKKVSGTYEWIQNLEYIKPLKDMDSLKAFIRQLDRGQTYCYTNEQLQGYYDKLAEIIRNDVISK